MSLIVYISCTVPEEVLKGLPQILQGRVPTGVWAVGKNDVDNMFIDPVHNVLQPNVRLPRVPQYKISRESELALQQVISDLLEDGVIV